MQISLISKCLKEYWSDPKPKHRILLQSRLHKLTKFQVLERSRASLRLWRKLPRGADSRRARWGFHLEPEWTETSTRA